MKILTIKSSQWLRPSQNLSADEFSSGLHISGTYCCLGICARFVHGIDESQLSHYGSPAALVMRFNKDSPREEQKEFFYAWCNKADRPYCSESFSDMFIGNNDLAMMAMCINDAYCWMTLYNQLSCHTPKQFSSETTLLTLSEIMRRATSKEFITDKERIDLLRPVFREAGYTIRFLPNR